MWFDLLVVCLISLPALIYGAVQWVTICNRDLGAREMERDREH